MINFHFNLFNFGRSITEPSNGLDWCKDWAVSANKHLEIQLTRWRCDRLLSVSLDTHWWGSDHAGPEFSIELLGLYFGIKLYDRRHWSYDNGRWETDEETNLIMNGPSVTDTRYRELLAQWSETENAVADREAAHQPHMADKGLLPVKEGVDSNVKPS